MVQMPALNTPQFDWSKSRMPNRAQPVPPIYQPEDRRTRRWCSRRRTGGARSTSGLPTVIAIVGNKLFPRLGDWYLGRTGVKGQQTAEKADHDKPDNLYEPVGGDPGAHGRFDSRKPR